MRLAECAPNLGVPEGAFAADVPAHLPPRHALEALAEAGIIGVTVTPGTAGKAAKARPPGTRRIKAS
jgi:hypothetical protein